MRYQNMKTQVHLKFKETEKPLYVDASGALQH